MPVAARRFTLAGLAFVGCRTDDGQSLPAGVSGSAASVRCVLPGPLTGPAQEIFPVLFTIEQTLPLFPASIGYARWVPTTPTGNLKWEYSMASAQINALSIRVVPSTSRSLRILTRPLTRFTAASTAFA